MAKDSNKNVSFAKEVLNVGLHGSGPVLSTRSGERIAIRKVAPSRAKDLSSPQSSKVNTPTRGATNYRAFGFVLAIRTG